MKEARVMLAYINDLIKPAGSKSHSSSSTSFTFTNDASSPVSGAQDGTKKSQKSDGKKPHYDAKSILKDLVDTD